MTNKVKRFQDILSSDIKNAGGKGGVLATLYQAAYPVPDGFVIFPSAFDGKTLSPESWIEIKKYIDEMQKNDPSISFAVRSSALAEDSSFASFAGEFESVLDVHTDDAIRAAINQVKASTDSDRVKAYGEAKGISDTSKIAIVVQELVRADFSGIFFTMDPVSGSRFEMQGNYIYGLGEDLVGGEAEPYTFTISYPKGKYAGPPELRKYAKRLFQLACNLEDLYGSPQDIEWAIANGKLYILQSRPITNLQPYDQQKGEWNISRMGDYVWVGQEVFPDVMTPATWSIFKNFQNMNIYRIPIMGNIHGRFYMNFSLAFKMFELMNKSEEYMLDYVLLTTGHDLTHVTVNPLPLNIGQILKAMLPKMVTMLPKQMALVRKFDTIIESNPGLCNETTSIINQIEDESELADSYQERVFPLFWNLLQVQDKANEDYFMPYMDAKQKLIQILGDEDAKTLLSKMTGSSNNLASIQSLVELQKLDNGLTTKEEYEKIAGHRPEKENEISEPRLYEIDGWIEDRLAEYRKTKIDYIAMADKRKQEFEKAWGDFEHAYPKKSRIIWKKIQKTLTAMEKREIIRSELTRSLGVIRNWYLRAGKLLEIGDDVFFLETDELIKVLRGTHQLMEQIAPRKAAYIRQNEYPNYPFVISGKFDLEEWLADSNRRYDFFDSHSDIKITDEEGVIRGQAGSAGQVTAKVRIIHSPSDGHLLEKGEILVASTTNVGWTPLFPRAAAVITDVGAPLSHAAIIARELGIPAVVGTSNATMRLKTGDTVTVNGTKGIVLIQ